MKSKTSFLPFGLSIDTLLKVFVALILLVTSVIELKKRFELKKPPQLSPEPIQEVADITRKELQRKQNDLVFNLHIERNRSCFLGDLDYLKAEVAQNISTPLLLTVENIGAQSFKPIKKNITYEDIVHGMDLSFLAPSSDVAIPLVISLCTDRAHTESCLNKDPLKMPNSTARNGDRNKQYLNRAGSDHIVFVSFFIEHNRGIEAVGPQLAESPWTEFIKYLDKLGLDKPTLAAVNAEQSMLKNLRSLPLRMTKTTIFIDMPGFDPDSCKPQAAGRAMLPNQGTL